MTLEEIDRALADWRQRLERIDQNLVALDEEPAQMRLEGALDQLEGVTRDRVVPALAAMRELFAQRGLLVDVLDRADKLRAGVNRLWPRTVPQQIESLLRGPSIALPAVETPLARRGLLDAAETSTSISLDQLLSAMTTAFEQARDAVMAAGEAWERLDADCDRAEAGVGRLEAQADGLGPEVAGEARASLAPTRAGIVAARERIERDPLGASRQLAVGGLEQVQGWLDGLARQKAQFDEQLAGAPTVVAALRQAEERARAAHERCMREIAGGPGLALPGADRVDGLEAWRAKLASTAADGRWRAAAVGLANWEAAAEALRGELEAAERASAALLDERDGLLGRLLIRRQQARGRPLDAAAESVADRAEALLRTVPAPLSEASAAVADYESRLNG